MNKKLLVVVIAMFVLASILGTFMLINDKRSDNQELDEATNIHENEDIEEIEPTFVDFDEDSKPTNNSATYHYLNNSISQKTYNDSQYTTINKVDDTNNSSEQSNELIPDGNGNYSLPEITLSD